MDSLENSRPDTLLPDRQQLKFPELLAPAGQPASLQAAIANGADAVYLGGAAFSARNRAANFGSDTLRQAIDQAHLHSVKVHLALNTLISDTEGSKALELAWQAACDGIDALIVQDIGLASQLRKNLPEVPLHASTQMTIGDEASLDFLASLGFQRVILPRELPLSDISEMTKLARERGIETEVFIHGALCCSYSGQCFLSQLQGGRSGNRGDCAQPCRLAYRMRKEDGTVLVPEPGLPNPHDSQPCFPWLSPRDQALWQHLPDLVSTGVHSLKIEGRMKDAAYVGTVTGIYRDLLDGRLPVKTERQQEAIRQKLLLAFNRGGHFTDKHLTGDRRQSLRAGPVSGSFGLLLGSVLFISQQTGELTIHINAVPAPVNLPSRGDVLVIRRDSETEAVASAPIGKIIHSDFSSITISGFHPRILRLLMPGDQVFQVTDTAPDDHLARLPDVHDAQDTQDTQDQQDKPRQTGIGSDCETGKTCLAAKIFGIPASNPDNLDTADLHADMNLPAEIKLKVTVVKGPHKDLFAEAGVPAEAVTPLIPARLEAQLRKTGQTSFAVAKVDQQDDICLRIGTLNQLRRDVLEKLSEKIRSSGCRDCGHLPPVWPAAGQTPADLKSGVAEAFDNNNRAGQPELVAYFYRLPDNLTDLACGADRYVFPLLSLDSETASAIRDSLHKKEPGSSCWAFVPAIANRVQETILNQKKHQLSSWGFSGLYSGRPGLACDELEQEAWDQANPDLNQTDAGQDQSNINPIQTKSDSGLMKALDWGAHLYNSEALRAFQAMGLRHLTPSTEITPRQAKQLMDAAGSGVNLEWPVYGRLRAMSIAICPIGEQHPDCRRCYTAQTNAQPDQAAFFSLTPQGRPRQQKRQEHDDASLRLQPHPLGCSCDVYSRQIFTADQESVNCMLQKIRISPEALISLRLTFLDETALDRTALVQALRQACRQPQPDLRLFWNAAQQASQTSGSPMEIKTIIQN